MIGFIVGPTTPRPIRVIIAPPLIYLYEVEGYNSLKILKPFYKRLTKVPHHVHANLIPSISHFQLSLI